MQALLGSMCGPNYGSIKYICEVGRRWLKRYSHTVIRWLYDSKECMDKYSATSLGILFKELGLDVDNLLTSDTYLTSMKHRLRSLCSMEAHRWPWCGIHSFLYEAAPGGPSSG